MRSWMQTYRQASTLRGGEDRPVTAATKWLGCARRDNDLAERRVRRAALDFRKKYSIWGEAQVMKPSYHQGN